VWVAVVEAGVDDAFRNLSFALESMASGRRAEGFKGQVTGIMET